MRSLAIITAEVRRSLDATHSFPYLLLTELGDPRKGLAGLRYKRYPNTT